MKDFPQPSYWRFLVSKMFRKLQNWFMPKKKKISAESTQTVQLLHILDVTQEDEIACGEVHELLDQFTEMQMRGENVSELMPLVKRHLDMCPECFEEYEALLAALAFEAT